MNTTNFAALDSFLGELVSIFTLDGVEYVRLSGLHKHMNKMGVELDPDMLVRTVNKFRAAGVIAWRYALICPHCGERFWQVTPREKLQQIKQCDNCQQLFVPEPGVSLVDVDHALRLKNNWPVC